MKNPADARYCPSCGDELPHNAVTLFADDTMDRYRATFACPECGYSGEVIRAGGISDMTLEVVTDSEAALVASPNDSRGDLR